MKPSDIKWRQTSRDSEMSQTFADGDVKPVRIIRKLLTTPTHPKYEYWIYYGSNGSSERLDPFEYRVWLETLQPAPRRWPDVRSF